MGPQFSVLSFNDTRFWIISVLKVSKTHSKFIHDSKVDIAQIYSSHIPCLGVCIVCMCCLGLEPGCTCESLYLEKYMDDRQNFEKEGVTCNKPY